MSDATFHSPVLSPLLAALAPEPAEPVPSADDDVVEAYSFNTGAKAMLHHMLQPMISVLLINSTSTCTCA